jgi:hypothetical protein
MTKRKSKGAYKISAVAEMYEIHPTTLLLYKREATTGIHRMRTKWCIL